MNNEMKVFENNEFGKVRTIMKDGEPWFVGKDVACILGYNNPSEALIDHVDSEDKLNSKTLSSLKLDLGQRGGWLINEAGLYSLVLSSKLESAKAFKRWITHEVLPDIRRHGMYATDDTVEKMLRDPDAMIAMLQAYKEEKKQRKLLQKENDTLTLQNRVLSGEKLKWNFKALLNALIRSYAHAHCDGQFAIGWRQFFKELYYKHGVGLERRKTAAVNKNPSEAKRALYTFITSEEEPLAIQTAVAMCVDTNVDITNVLKENVCEDELVINGRMCQ